MKELPHVAIGSRDRTPQQNAILGIRAALHVAHTVFDRVKLGEPGFTADRPKVADVLHGVGRAVNGDAFTKKTEFGRLIMAGFDLVDTLALDSVTKAPTPQGPDLV